MDDRGYSESTARPGDSDKEWEDRQMKNAEESLKGYGAPDESLPHKMLTVPKILYEAGKYYVKKGARKISE